MTSSASSLLAELLGRHESPCISLYQPTHRHFPDNQQDAIRYRNLLKRIDDALRTAYPSREVKPLMENFRVLGERKQFWDHQRDGLAVLGSPNFFQVFTLQRPVEELLVVSDSFHIKPLLRIQQSADRFQVLCLSKESVRLLEGDRYVMDEVEGNQVPRTMAAALGAEKVKTATPAHHSAQGQGDGGTAKNAEQKSDLERFFRAVDRAVTTFHSQPSRLPLIIVGLREYHDIFRRVSHNPFLIPEGITANPAVMNADLIRAEAWKVMEPRFEERLTRFLDDFQSARVRTLASGDVTDVTRAILAGRVGTLLVDADRRLPGSVTWETGEIHPQNGYGNGNGNVFANGPSQTGNGNGNGNGNVVGKNGLAAVALSAPLTKEDILDDLAEGVLRRGGEVLLVPSSRMPTTSGVAATYRF